MLTRKCTQGDTLFHLLPEIFLGEAEPDHARFILVNPNKNILLGVAIMVGFLTFVAMDKGLRIATGGEGHRHDHDHKADDSSEKKEATATSSGAASEPQNRELKPRKRTTTDSSPSSFTKSQPAAPSTSIRLSAYLNLLADFTHNITVRIFPSLIAAFLLLLYLRNMPLKSFYSGNIFDCSRLTEDWTY